MEIGVSSVSCHFSSFIFFFWNVLPQIIISCWSSYNITEIIWESHKSGMTRRRAEKCNPLGSIQALQSSACNCGHLHWPDSINNQSRNGMGLLVPYPLLIDYSSLVVHLLLSITGSNRELQTHAHTCDTAYSVGHKAKWINMNPRERFVKRHERKWRVVVVSMHCAHVWNYLSSNFIN